MVDISEFNYDSDMDFCMDLAQKVKVGAVPGSSFFKDNEQRYIRFHFAKRDETLYQAIDNLSHLRELIKPKL